MDERQAGKALVEAEIQTDILHAILRDNKNPCLGGKVR
jgi:hypothetical protein